jgi:glycine betaine/proline transport system ATP-binding protein
VITCTSLTKVFGPRPREALALLERGESRAAAQAASGCTIAVRDVSFEVERGELFVIMGLSGSGKSTLLRTLNRLVEPTRGTVSIDGQDVTAMDERDLRELRGRRVSMVFQHFALLPHRTVLENVAYPLRLHGSPNQEERAQWALAEVGLGDWGGAYPGELSGGMRQRVGLARALATEADVMLMDEPFSALDPLIRRQVQDLLIRLQAELRKTIVFVTHDLNEAMRLGDRIMMLRDGAVVQCASGSEILAAPADEYVADFVADVDRSRVLTAADVMREARITALLREPPELVLTRLEEAEANGIYVLDQEGHIVGVARDDALAQAIRAGMRELPRELLVDDYATTDPHRPLVELFHLLGRHSVPLAVTDAGGRLLGVVPRAAVLSALAAREREPSYA